MPRDARAGRRARPDPRAAPDRRVAHAPAAGDAARDRIDAASRREDGLTRAECALGDRKIRVYRDGRIEGVVEVGPETKLPAPKTRSGAGRPCGSGDRYTPNPS